MKAKDLKDLTVDELRVKERDLYDQLFKLRFQAATAQLEKPATGCKLNRIIYGGRTIRKHSGA
jgi:large subunit ribosomal protein L29